MRAVREAIEKMRQNAQDIRDKAAGVNEFEVVAVCCAQADAWDDAATLMETTLDAATKVEPDAERVWDFHWDCGRMGDVESRFVAKPSQIEEMIGKEAYFGEILGKHSEIYGTLKREHFAEVEGGTDPVLVKMFSESPTGYCPLSYVQTSCQGEGCPYDEVLPAEEFYSHEGNYLCHECYDKAGGFKDAEGEG